jgi:uncharacterized membrane protein
MAKNKALIAVALASLIGSGVAVAAGAEEGKCWSTKEFQIKKGDNGCKSANHSCKGQGMESNRENREFKIASKADCAAWKGEFKALDAK